MNKCLKYGNKYGKQYDTVIVVFEYCLTLNFGSNFLVIGFPLKFGLKMKCGDIIVRKLLCNVRFDP